MRRLVTTALATVVLGAVAAPALAQPHGSPSYFNHGHRDYRDARDDYRRGDRDDYRRWRGHHSHYRYSYWHWRQHEWREHHRAWHR